MFFQNKMKMEPRAQSDLDLWRALGSRGPRSPRGGAPAMPTAQALGTLPEAQRAQALGAAASAAATHLAATAPVPAAAIRCRFCPCGGGY
jgi:hypothetical protein